MYTVEKQDMYDAYREMHKLRAVWSIYTIPNIDAMSGITAESLVYKNNWGTPVTIALPRGEKTWGELYHAADRAIHDSGDDHHIYIEQLRQEGNAVMLETGS